MPCPMGHSGLSIDCHGRMIRLGTGNLRVVVRTRYMGPTDTRGSRIMVDPLTASSLARSPRSFPYSYALDSADAHTAAVESYAASVEADSSARVEFLGCARNGHGNIYVIEFGSGE